MLRRATIAAATLAAVLLPGGAAHADLAWGPCTQKQASPPPVGDWTYQCAALAVPLDRTGRQLGTLTLEVARETEEITDATTPLVVLLGGPGEAGVAYASNEGYALRGGSYLVGLPGAPRGKPPRAPQIPYRIHAIDLRGTAAGALSCPSLQQLKLTDVTVAPPGLVVDCAQTLGPARNAYATSETVEDLEALRVALGVERLALAGSDYGSYVALQYAQAHPDRVERLLLDSVVPREGVGTRLLATYPAIRAALIRQCEARRCRGVTGSAISALRRTLFRAGTKGLEAPVYAPGGTATTVVLDEPAIFDTVREALGLDWARFDLVPALAAAAAGDDLPLARLSRRVREVYALPASRYSQATRAAALCADLGPPGAYGPPDTKDVAPFSVFIAERNGLADTCARWPATTAPRPPAPGPLPAIPTLLISGEYDVATPAGLANTEAARIPGAVSLVVPATGHFPVLNGYNDCARLAAARFLAGRPLGAVCPAGPHSLVGPAYPSSLSRAPRAAGVPGIGGRIVGAAFATVDDLRTFTLTSRDGIRIAGLRGGWGVLQHGGKAATVTLRGAELVPGVKVRGTYVRTYAHVVVKKRKRVRVPEAFTARFTLRGPGLDASFTLTADRRIVGQRNGTPFAGRLPTSGSLLI